MSTRRSASGVGATALLLSALGFSIFTVAMIARNGLADVSWGVPGAAGLWAVAYAVAGYLIAINRPRNPIGWMMLTGGMLASMMGASLEYLGALDTSDLFGRAAAMVAASAWISVVGLLSASILKFPDGRLPSRRWRSVAWWLALSATAFTAFTVRQMARFLSDKSPSEFDLAAFEITSGGLVLNIVFQLAVVAGFSAIVVRIRRSTGVERQQLKWLGFAAGIVIAMGVISEVVLQLMNLPDLRRLSGQILSVVILLVPASIGIAILKYRLYEIDRVINRTVVYGAVVVVLVSVYGAGVFVLRELLPLEGDLAVAASTLAVAALFNPLRTRVQRVVDRRFYRSRYDAQRIVEEFSHRLAGEVDLAALSEDWLATVDQAVKPRTAQVWLR